MEDRRELASLLLAETRIGDELTTLLTVSEQMAESLVRCLEQGHCDLLKLPAFT